MARLAHDREQAVRPDEPRQQVVLNLARDALLARPPSRLATKISQSSRTICWNAMRDPSDDSAGASSRLTVVLTVVCIPVVGPTMSW